jgi:putative membrane protein
MPRWLPLVLVAGFLVALAWSGYQPRDRLTWFLEVAPALAGFVVLAATYRRFPLTTLTYVLLWIHALILMVGGYYTYAEMPLFNWLRDTYHLSRNYYDRVGHLAQGFVPAIVSREILLRKSPLRPGGWLFLIVVCICLSISALYELIEWRAAVALGSAADAFLGTQGDPWDTQWDMAMALIGAILALLLLSRAHDRALERLKWG